MFNILIPSPDNFQQNRGSIFRNTKHISLVFLEFYSFKRTNAISGLYFILRMDLLVFSDLFIIFQIISKENGEVEVHNFEAKVSEEEYLKQLEYMKNL